MQRTMTRTAVSDKTLRLLAFVGLLLLVIEFLFGMLVNLYVSIPSPLPGSTPSTSGGVLYGLAWSLGQTSMPTLLLHVVVGLLLVLISLALLVFSLVARRWQWLAASLIAVAGIILATLSGTNFVESGRAVSSLVMALGFLLALTAYAVGLYVTQPKSQPS
jgi:drug/metabolite transporter (DMT)-like permease